MSEENNKKTSKGVVRCVDCDAPVSSSTAYRCLKTSKLPRCKSCWTRGAPECRDCGKRLRRHRIKRCRNCYLVNRKQEPRFCIDCGKSLKWGIKRCSSCNREFYSGERSPAWKGGKPHCVNCGKIVDNYGTKWCHTCGNGRWAEEEIRMLKEFYPYMPAKELANQLGRSTAAVTQRAAMYGIKGDRRTHYFNNWEFIKSNPYEVLYSVEIGYIAGIFDGEGHLVLKRERFWDLGITNTNYSLLEWLKRCIPHSRIRQGRKGQKNHKAIWQWGLNGNLKVQALLQVLLPYLIVKKSKAEEALNLIARTEGDLIELQRRTC